MKLDAYEYVGVAIPGAVMLFICLLIFPEFRSIIGRDGIQLGGLGLVLILSLAVGQMLQAIGTFIRWMDYTLPIDKSNSLLNEQQKFLEVGQWRRLVKALKKEFQVDLIKLNKTEWASIRLEMQSAVRGAGGGSKLDTFTRNGGLSRGLVSAYLVSIPLVLLFSELPKTTQWQFVGGLLGCAVLAYCRMRRALNFYLHNLIVEFVRLTGKDAGPSD